MLPELFIKYSKIFKDRGYCLYMVGGSSRDYLLGRYFEDYDFVTNATPEQMKEFLPNIDCSFSRFGSIRIKGEEFEIDVTTLREEGDYQDSRHPSFIKFISDIETDSKRRDFTINAIYIDDSEKVYDFYGGLDDLQNHIIRFIGNPEERIKEDPIRILRAQRFSDSLNFTMEENTFKACEKLKSLISKLNENKVHLELNKCKKKM